MNKRKWAHDDNSMFESVIERQTNGLWTIELYRKNPTGTINIVFIRGGYQTMWAYWDFQSQMVRALEDCYMVPAYVWNKAQSMCKGKQ